MTIVHNKTPAEYSQEVVSMWGVTLKDAFVVASTKRPVADWNFIIIV